MAVAGTIPETDVNLKKTFLSGEFQTYVKVDMITSPMYLSASSLNC